MTLKINIDKWQHFFIDNELQYSVGTANIGNEISRTQFNEQPHFEKLTYHPDNNKVAKRVNNYFILKGSIKNTWTFDEDDQISNDDIEFATDIVKNDPEHSEAIITSTDNTVSFTYKESYLQKNWLDTSFPYELACNKSKLEFLEDGVVRSEVDVAANTEFRILWPRGDLGQLPEDFEQSVRLDHAEEDIQNLYRKVETLGIMVIEDGRK